MVDEEEVVPPIHDFEEDYSWWTNRPLIGRSFVQLSLHWTQRMIRLNGQPSNALTVRSFSGSESWTAIHMPQASMNGLLVHDCKILSEFETSSGKWVSISRSYQWMNGWSMDTHLDSWCTWLPKGQQIRKGKGLWELIRNLLLELTLVWIPGSSFHMWSRDHIEDEKKRLK